MLVCAFVHNHQKWQHPNASVASGAVSQNATKREDEKRTENVDFLNFEIELCFFSSFIYLPAASFTATSHLHSLTRFEFPPWLTAMATTTARLATQQETLKSIRRPIHRAIQLHRLSTKPSLLLLSLLRPSQRWRLNLKHNRLRRQDQHQLQLQRRRQQ